MKWAEAKTRESFVTDTRNSVRVVTGLTSSAGPGCQAFACDQERRRARTRDRAERQDHDIERHRSRAAVRGSCPGSEEAVLEEVDTVGERIHVREHAQPAGEMPYRIQGAGEKQHREDDEV